MERITFLMKPILQWSSAAMLKWFCIIIAYCKIGIGPFKLCTVSYQIGTASCQIGAVLHQIGTASCLNGTASCMSCQFGKASYQIGRIAIFLQDRYNQWR